MWMRANLGRPPAPNNHGTQRNEQKGRPGCNRHENTDSSGPTRTENEKPKAEQRGPADTPPQTPQPLPPGTAPPCPTSCPTFSCPGPSSAHGQPSSELRKHVIFKRLQVFRVWDTEQTRYMHRSQTLLVWAIFASVTSVGEHPADTWPRALGIALKTHGPPLPR